MRRLENLFVNTTASDLLDAAIPIAESSDCGFARIVSEYEKAVAQLFGCKHAVAVNSGTVSIYCVLRALGVGPGDEVVLPATAVVMSALPVALLGGTVVFADNMSAHNLGLDGDAVREALTPRTKAVVSVPLWGYPTPMDELVAACKERGVALLEDIGQSHGTSWKGRSLGTFGLAGCASTHERKLITTGEGGLVLTDDDTLAAMVGVLANYGADAKGIGRNLGCNFKLSGPSAALGITQVAKLKEKIHMRAAIAHSIIGALAGVDWATPFPVAADGEQNFYSLVMQIRDPKISAREVDQHLADRMVISDTWRYRFRPLYEYPLFATGGKPCKNAEAIIASVFTLPCHEGLNEADINQISDAVKSFRRSPNRLSNTA